MVCRMKRFFILLVIMLFLLSSCHVHSDDQKITQTATSTSVRTSPVPPTLTVTPEPLETLTICTTNLPGSLFLYDGSQSAAKKNILAILQDEPFERVNGDLIPNILEKIPSQADGDLRLEPVSVQRGQPVVDARGELVILSPGVTIRPSGCRSSDCAMTWNGDELLEMDQMVVDFKLRDDLTWSDGTPLTASDSVYSFKLASVGEALDLKWAEERTETYTAVDNSTIVWIGVPGFTTARLDAFFWTPLPSYLFDESETLEEIAGDERLTESLFSFGPFMIASRDENSISFIPNPHYFRSDEGLPFLDQVTYKVIDGEGVEAWERLQRGDCDILDSSFGWAGNWSLIEEIQTDEKFDVLEQPGESWTQLVFGIQPESYDDFYNPVYGDRPDLLGDERTRKAIAMSLDRNAMLEAAAGGMGELWYSFISPHESQLADDDGISYDPEMSAELLDQVGWRDHDMKPETPLQAWSVKNVPMGTEFALELLITQSGFHQALAEIIHDSLQAIGINVTVVSMPSEALYAPGPEGLIFGRQFDLTLLTWQSMLTLDCRLYHTWQIPSDQDQWIGTNIAGFSNNDYDNTCAEASLALENEESISLYYAEKMFIDLLPAVPLLAKPSFMIIKNSNCGDSLENSHVNFFENIESYMGDKNCP